MTVWGNVMSYMGRTPHFLTATLRTTDAAMVLPPRDKRREPNLQHQWQRLHHVVEIPHDYLVQSSLPIMAVSDGRPSPVDLKNIDSTTIFWPLLGRHKRARRQG